MAVVGSGLDDRDPHLFLWNPITGNILRLPPIAKIPHFAYFREELARHGYINLPELVKRVEVLPFGGCARGASSLVVAAIFGGNVGGYQALVLCRPEAREWRVCNVKNGNVLEDIIFHRGILYGLISRTVEEEAEEEEQRNLDGVEVNDDGDQPTNYTYAIDMNGFEVKFCELHLKSTQNLNQTDNEAEIFSGFWIAKKMLGLYSLAESCDGDQLFLVGRIMDMVGMHPPQDYGGGGDVILNDAADTALSYFRVSTFVVGLINNVESISGLKCTSLTRLEEGQALFVATSGSLSRCQRNGSGGDDNCIYFLADQQCNYDGSDPYVTRESGVFCFDTKKIKRCFPSMMLPAQCNIGWFTPKLHP